MSMFGKRFTSHQYYGTMTVNQSSVNNSTMTEIRAPTDASVQLLRELQEAAIKEIHNSIKVKDTTFEAVIHQGTDALSGELYLKAIFSLNGKRLIVDVTESSFILRDTKEAREAFVCKLRDAIATKIASEILLSVMSQVKL